jgi:DNA-binding transcriptional LysR family regulator
VLERADAVLNAYETLAAVSDSGASKVAGEIRFSAPASLGAGRLAALLGDFMTRHPAVRVDLLLNDLPVDLIEHGVDLALAVAWELPPSVIARRIGEERVGVYGAPKYLRRRGMPKHPDELSRHDCLVCTGGGRKPWHFGHPVSGQRIEPAIEPRLLANNANALLAAAVHGSGVALLPHVMAQRAVKAGQLQPVLSPLDLADARHLSCVQLAAQFAAAREGADRPRGGGVQRRAGHAASRQEEESGSLAS